MTRLLSHAGRILPICEQVNHISHQTQTGPWGSTKGRLGAGRRRMEQKPRAGGEEEEGMEVVGHRFHVRREPVC